MFYTAFYHENEGGDAHIHTHTHIYIIDTMGKLKIYEPIFCMRQAHTISQKVL